MAPPRSSACALLLAALAASCAASNDVTRAPVAAAQASAGPSAAPEPLASGRLPGTARPTHYALSLVVDPAKERFLGDVTIDVDVPAATEAIVLHGRDLTVIRAEALVGGQPVSAQAELRRAAGGKGTPEEMVLTLARKIPAGKAQLRIAYSAPLDTKLSGLYRVEEAGAFYAFTQFEPMDARRMFPCFDEPGFKVPFDLKVTTPKGNLVVGNSGEVERTESDDGRSTTFTFAPTPPLPTYLLALAVGPFEVREGAASPVKIRLIATKGKTRLGELALEAAAAHVKILGEYFDRPYPYAKLDLLAVPEFGFGAMENAGLITFREDLVLLDPQSASVAARRSMAENVAHEISHHWFGDLVTMEWWDDLWLNEGFATWMETRVVDVWRPAMNARLEALGDKGWVMGLDALDSARAVRQPVTSNSEAEEAFDGITYEKGASVLEMIESWLGPDAFRAGVRAYIKAHEHGSATSADLFAALSKASGKEVLPIASTFLDQPGVPLVRAALACDGAKGGPDAGKGARVTLSQARYRARLAAPAGVAPEGRVAPSPAPALPGEGAPPRPSPRDEAGATWKIPLCVAYEGGEKDGPACGLLDGPTGEIALPGGRCPRWIYPNAHDSGYFRFALPPDQLAALSGAGKGLDVRSRIGLVNNAWALVQSGDLGADALLDLLSGMRRERQRLVVAQMIDTLTSLSDTLVSDDIRPAFQAYASSILLPIAKELGWDARRTDTDEERLLRKGVLSALATLAEDPWLVAEADRRAAAFLKEPRSVDADIAALALRLSARRAGEGKLAELTEALGRASPTPPTPEHRRAILGALGSFADPALLRKALDWTLAERVKLQDAYALFDGAAEWPASRPHLIAWMRDHAEELKEKLPDFAIVRLSEVLGTICDGAGRAGAAAFFGEELKDVEGADRRLQQALETVDLCIDLRAREGARLKKRLGGGARRAGK
jgi:aminopeptidase N